MLVSFRHRIFSSTLAYAVSWESGKNSRYASLPADSHTPHGRSRTYLSQAHCGPFWTDRCKRSYPGASFRPFSLPSSSARYLSASRVPYDSRIKINNNIGLFIPCGVAHGFVTLTEATHTYIVDSYYNGGADENGVAWNDPDLNVAWNVENPIVSGRDAANLLLRDIAPENLPK